MSLEDYQLPPHVLPAINKALEDVGKATLTEDELRALAATTTVQEFSNENRTIEFYAVNMGEKGGTYILAADFNLVGFFEGKAYFVRSGLTERELIESKFNRALADIQENIQVEAASQRQKSVFENNVVTDEEFLARLKARQDGNGE